MDRAVSVCGVVCSSSVTGSCTCSVRAYCVENILHHTEANSQQCSGTRHRAVLVCIICMSYTFMAVGSLRLYMFLYS